MANPAISRFLPIFMPPADFIVGPTDAEKTRSYLTNPNGPAYNYVNAANALATQNNSRNHRNLDAARAAFAAESTRIRVVSLPAVQRWLDNVFSALAARLPHVHPADDRYTDDVLYIVTLPEFGLNGWKDSPMAPIKWDASGAFPQSLEQDIQERILVRLASDQFRKLHILFVFSCFSHTEETKPSPAPPKAHRIKATNRLSVLYRTNPTAGVGASEARTITKFAWNAVDQVMRPIFTPDKAWDARAQDMLFGAPRNMRFEETQLELPWRHVDGSAIALGFGTCQDVGTDGHPHERLVILCGSGTPFMRKPEIPNLPMKYPFLLNDKLSWSTQPRQPIRMAAPAVLGTLRKDELSAAGYYQYLNVSPGTPSVRDNYAEWLNGDGSAHATQDRAEMADYYLTPPTVQSIPGTAATDVPVNALVPATLIPVSFHDAITHEKMIMVSTTQAAVPLYQYTLAQPFPPPR